MTLIPFSLPRSGQRLPHVRLFFLLHPKFKLLVHPSPVHPGCKPERTALSKQRYSCRSNICSFSFQCTAGCVYPMRTAALMSYCFFKAKCLTPSAGFPLSVSTYFVLRKPKKPSICFDRTKTQKVKFNLILNYPFYMFGSEYLHISIFQQLTVLQ